MKGIAIKTSPISNTEKKNTQQKKHKKPNCSLFFFIDISALLNEHCWQNRFWERSGGLQGIHEPALGREPADRHREEIYSEEN